VSFRLYFSYWVQADLVPSIFSGGKQEAPFSYLFLAALQRSRHIFACVPFTNVCHAFTLPALLLLLGHDNG
jgi:hypothetical protein